MTIIKRKKDWVKKLKSVKVYEGSTEVDSFFRGLDETVLRSTNSVVLLSEDKPAQIRKQAKKSNIALDSPLRLTNEQAKAIAEEAGIPWDDSYNDRVLPHWGSDERVDGHGDIVLQNWDFSSFKENPAMPFNHNWHQLPVGVHLSWEVRNKVSEDYVGPSLLLQSLYATKEQLPEGMGDSLYRLTLARMLRMNSVGFSSGRVIVIEDDKERNELGLGRWGAILDDNLLLEDSPTLIGANPGALLATNSAKKAGLKLEDLTTLREINRQNSETEEQFENTDDSILKAAKKLFGEELNSDRDITKEFELEESKTSTVFASILNSMEDEEEGDDEKPKDKEATDDNDEPENEEDTEDSEDSEDAESFESGEPETESEDEEEVDEEEEDKDKSSNSEEDDKPDKPDKKSVPSNEQIYTLLLNLSDRINRLSSDVSNMSDNFSDCIDEIGDNVNELGTSVLSIQSTLETKELEEDSEESLFSKILSRYDN